MKAKGKAKDGEPRPERFTYTSLEQIEWVYKTPAHLAAEAALAAKQTAERAAEQPQAVRPAD
ncbi:MAG TPA: hypothetical protein VH916_05175 [Dehalococcoidia bacterium]|jgi:hypothetical protein